MPSDDDLITNEQAARIYGVRPSTWSSYVTRRQAPQPVDRQFGHPLFSRGEVEQAAVQRQRRRSDPDADEEALIASLTRLHSQISDSGHDTDVDANNIERRRQLLHGLAERGFSNSFLARASGISRHTIVRILADE